MDWIIISLLKCNVNIWGFFFFFWNVKVETDFKKQQQKIINIEQFWFDLILRTAYI